MRLLAALIVGLAVLALALQSSTLQLPERGGIRARFADWLREHPPRLIVVVAIGLLVTVLLSALASPLASTSLRGFEAGRDGQSFLSVASVLTVFFAIALRLRRPAQIWRLVGAIAAGVLLSSLYAIAQAAEIDPFGVDRFAPDQRFFGSFGNPIFAGSALVLGLPVALLVGALATARWGARAGVPVGAGVIAIVLTALLLTLARGPWIGGLSGAALFLGAAWRYAPRHLLRPILLSVLAGAAVAAGALALLNGPTDQGTLLAAAIGRAESLPAVATGGLSGRVDIWGSALELTAERPWPALEDRDGGGPVVVRHLLGYGPDTFLYTYPLREEPAPQEEVLLTKDGHNQHLHAIVELGLLGLIVTLAVTIVPLAAGAYLLVSRADQYSWEMRLLLVAVLAALVGRAVEQLVGVAQLSDALLHWALLGLLVALPASPTKPDQDVAAGATGLVRPVAAGVITLALGIGLTILLMGHAVGPVLAARDADRAADAFGQGDGLAAFDSIVSAVDRSPSVASYRLSAVDLITFSRDSSFSNEERTRLTRLAVNLLEEGVAESPFSVELNANLAVQRLELADQVGTGGDLAIDAFRRTVALLPKHWQPLRSLAAGLFHLGLPNEALEPLNRALVLLGVGPEAADLLLLRAQVLLDLGRVDEAATDLRVGLALEPAEPVRAELQLVLDALEAPTGEAAGE